jgi:hypothetical protein
MFQSIIGATEKRRESGAGVALVTDMGDLESVRLGGGGVYQEWGCGVWVTRVTAKHTRNLNIHCRLTTFHDPRHSRGLA